MNDLLRVAFEAYAHEKRMLGSCGCGVCLLIRQIRQERKKEAKPEGEKPSI